MVEGCGIVFVYIFKDWCIESRENGEVGKELLLFMFFIFILIVVCFWEWLFLLKC